MKVRFSELPVATSSETLFEVRISAQKLKGSKSQFCLVFVSLNEAQQRFVVMLRHTASSLVEMSSCAEHAEELALSLLASIFVTSIHHYCSSSSTNPRLPPGFQVTPAPAPRPCATLRARRRSPLRRFRKVRSQLGWLGVGVGGCILHSVTL